MLALLQNKTEHVLWCLHCLEKDKCIGEVIKGCRYSPGACCFTILKPDIVAGLLHQQVQKFSLPFTYLPSKKLLSTSTLTQIFINPRSHISKLCSLFATFRVCSASVSESVPPLLATSHLHWVNLPCHSISHSTSEHFPLPLHNLIWHWGSLLWLCCSKEWHALYLCR